MPNNNAQPSLGFRVRKCDLDGPTNPVEVAELTDCGLPGFEPRSKEVTNHASPNGVVQRKAVLTDITSFPAEINLNVGDPTHAYALGGLLYDAKNRIERYWDILFPNGVNRWYGPAFIALKPKGNPVDGIQMATITFNPTDDWFLV